MAPFALSAAGNAPPAGLELYSVRGELAKDLKGAVTQVARMGYQVVEFYAPYFEWTREQAKDVRKLLDDLGIRCLSTHNSLTSFGDPGIAKAIDYNRILGARYVICGSAGEPAGIDGWKRLGDAFTKAAETLRTAGLRAGYHNHQLEFRPVDGKLPMEVLAAATPKDFVLQLDVGTCVEAGYDPVRWINAHPGRFQTIHCKDWAPGTRAEEKEYRVLFGEGVCPWKRIFDAAERTGGVECYLVEQEGSRYPKFETARRCLDNWKKLRA